MKTLGGVVCCFVVIGEGDGPPSEIFVRRHKGKSYRVDKTSLSNFAEAAGQ
jgi:hypothetical protein